MLERLATGIPGLDQVLVGGFVRGDACLVMGAVGTGKTTLANQLAHNVARAGGTALFVTVLAEQHDRMLTHLRGFGFFDPSLVGRRVHYVSLYDPLRTGGLDAVLGQARALVREHRATLLLMDGAGHLGRHAASDVAMAQFVMSLNSQLSRLGCTTLLFSDQTDPGGTHASLLDAIVRLHDEALGLHQLRLVEVVKMRGVDYLRGRHQFVITAAGIQVYPRLEASVAHDPPVADARPERAAFGVPGLDEMLRGGLVAGSTTLLLGAPGAGKTTAGLHLLVEGARRGEAGLIATFHETPPRLIAKADKLGLELGPLVEAGRVRILWRPPVEVLLDAWTHEVLATVEEHSPRRLFIEAVTDLERLAVVPDRMYGFLTALSVWVRARGITTLLSADIPAVVGGQPALPEPALSASIENAILLRYVELHSHLHRLLSIVKTRESAHDTSIREFAITERGLDVAATFESAEAVLTGIARLVPSSAAPSRPRQTEAG
jgi:circadian clock protein KaiC